MQAYRDAPCVESSLHDMHLHLGFSPCAQSVARDAQSCGAQLFCNTVTPQEYEEISRELAGYRTTHLGLGLHPWWISADTLDDKLMRFEKALASTRFIGEVGLDFSAKHAHTQQAQIRALTHIAAHVHTQAQTTGKAHIISLHAVHAASKVLDILDASGCLESCRCILHWFSGNDQELQRAVQCGVYFSINPRMLESRRGRNRVLRIPHDRMLLETDLPAEEGAALSFKEIQGVLEHTMDELCVLRDDTALREVIRTNTYALLADELR